MRRWLLHEFLGWLVGLLVVRGVPRDLLVRGLEVLREQLADDLVVARELLLVGQRWARRENPAPSIDDAAPQNGDAAL